MLNPVQNLCGDLNFGHLNKFSRFANLKLLICAPILRSTRFVASKTLQECGAECYSKNLTFTSVWYWSVRLVGSVASVGWEVTGISFKSALTSKSLLCSAFWPGLFLAGNRQFSRYRQKWQGMQQVGNRRRRRRGIPKTRIKMGQGQYQLTNVSIIKK